MELITFCILIVLIIRRSHKWLEYLLPSHDQEDFVLRESGILVDQPSPSSSNAFPPDYSEATAVNPATGTAASEPSPPTLFSQSRVPSLSPDPLRRLLDETSDLIDSPTATHITTLLLDALFSQLTDVAIKQQAYKLPDPSLDPSAQVQEIVEGSTADPWNSSAKLATILAVITRQAHMIGNGMPNVYVQCMEDVRELEAFAAVIYSSNFELERVVAQARPGTAGGEEDEGTTPAPASAAEAAAQTARAAASAVVAEQKNTGIVGATWGVFEGVWNRVSGQ